MKIRLLILLAISFIAQQINSMNIADIFSPKTTASAFNSLVNYLFDYLNDFDDIETFKNLLERKLKSVNINSIFDQHGNSLIYTATLLNRPDIVKLLLEKNIDINLQNLHNKNTAIHAARTIEMIELLVKNKANINARNNFGETPYIIRLQSNNFIAAKYLRDLGCHVDEKDVTICISILLIKKIKKQAN